MSLLRSNRFARSLLCCFSTGVAGVAAGVFDVAPLGVAGAGVWMLGDLRLALSLSLLVDIADRSELFLVIRENIDSFAFDFTLVSSSLLACQIEGFSDVHGSVSLVRFGWNLKGDNMHRYRFLAEHQDFSIEFSCY